MKECPKHPAALAMEAWKFCPLCGAALVESIAGIPVIISPAIDGVKIVSTETLHDQMKQEADRIFRILGEQAQEGHSGS
ncbi:MAG TPA: hypothetical protein VIH42_08155 [Thermoguttaceae bacterium]